MFTGNENQIIKSIDSMTIGEARKAIASGQFGSNGRPDRAFASEYLSSKEAEERDKREAETLSIAQEANELAREVNLRTSDIDVFNRRAVRKDRIIAIIAIIIATIAVRADIIWFISWLISKIKTS